MKNYLLENSSHWHGICVTLRNLDIDSPSAYLSQIHFKACEYKNHKEAELGCGDSKSLALEIEFKKGKETKEIKAHFESMPGIFGGSRLDHEAFIIQEDTKNIIQAIKVIQEMDRIPLSALREIQTRTKMDFSCFFYDEAIIQSAQQEKHQEALEKALKEYKKGDEEGLAVLAEFYQKKYETSLKELVQGNDKCTVNMLAKFYQKLPENKKVGLSPTNILAKFNKSKETLDLFLGVLEHFPKDHKKLAEMSSWGHEMLLPFLDTKNQVEKSRILNQLFILSIDANLPEVSSKHYNTLCGYREENALPFQVKADSFTLVAAADDHKNKLEEINSLEQKLAHQKNIIKNLEAQLNSSQNPLPPAQKSIENYSQELDDNLTKNKEVSKFFIKSQIQNSSKLVIPTNIKSTI